MVVDCCCTSCVELYRGFYPRILFLGFTVKQHLLWATCTGRHWLIVLWVTIGST